ncbi:MAG: hypothetical protein HWE27_15760 [Gammaproteobacteria bacterium]|nr:hypothetical protein [Gammaproteobacteria bacterium]
MAKGFVFEWVFISWMLSLFIHHHNIKRASISSLKDDLIELLTKVTEFKWLESSDVPLYQEERYNTKVSRVSWKLKQLNKLASTTLVSEEKLNPLYNFDFETFTNPTTSEQDKEALKYSLQECCDDIIDTVEKNHFNKIMSSKLYIFWSARHSVFGILSGLGIVYLFLQIMRLLFS